MDHCVTSLTSDFLRIPSRFSFIFVQYNIWRYTIHILKNVLTDSSVCIGYSGQSNAERRLGRSCCGHNEVGYSRGAFLWTWPVSLWLVLLWMGWARLRRLPRFFEGPALSGDILMLSNSLYALYTSIYASTVIILNKLPHGQLGTCLRSKFRCRLA